MQLVFVLLTLLLLAVALFALQNSEHVTIRFWPWQVQASLAVVTLAATAVGALIAALLSWASQLRRWKRARAANRLSRESGVPPEPRSSAGPPTP
jgi:uncharacterized integral membrane protein